MGVEQRFDPSRLIWDRHDPEGTGAFLTLDGQWKAPGLSARTSVVREVADQGAKHAKSLVDSIVGEELLELIERVPKAGSVTVSGTVISNGRR